MRLTAEQIAVIKQNTALIFGENAQVFLFGSRIDDSKKGGDIDLFIDLMDKIERPIEKILYLNGLLQQALGMQKIDIIFHAPSYSYQPIHTAAKETGILL
jgi:hypothetical protein